MYQSIFMLQPVSFYLLEGYQSTTGGHLRLGFVLEYNCRKMEKSKVRG